MDAPRIQYAKTEDDVSIAYWKKGQGKPLVYLSSFLMSHARFEWDTSRRVNYDQLAEGSMLLKFDPRGMGMSQRSQIDFSPEALSLDLHAVMKAEGLKEVSIICQASMRSMALDFASRHPANLTRLIFLPQAQVSFIDDFDLLVHLTEDHWELVSNVYSRLAYGWDGPEATQTAALLRATHTPRSFLVAWEERKKDMTKALDWSVIRCPTLFIYRMESNDEEEMGRNASQVSNSRLIGVPGTWRGTPNAQVREAILEFIESGSPLDDLPRSNFDIGAFRTILFTDIEGHTAMMQRLGDAKGREVLRDHERLTRGALAAHGGAEVKTMGDGFMASFGSAQKAIECAIALQQAFAARASEEPIRIRVGINAGEPIAEDDDLFGTSVILAARTAAKADGGEILVTDVVRQLVAGKGFHFTDHGEAEMKGFEEAVRLFAVEWQ